MKKQYTVLTMAVIDKQSGTLLGTQSESLYTDMESEYKTTKENMERKAVYMLQKPAELLDIRFRKVTF